jgi:Tol biopolymer transport system component
MKIPIIPLVMTVILAGAAGYLYTASPSAKLVLGVPRLTRLTDVDGTETEVAIAPDGIRCAVIASGDVWLVNLSDGSRRQITKTPAAESFPSWTPDGRKLTFTRGDDTFAISVDDNLTEQLLKPTATFMNWAGTGAAAFVRDRALWITAADGTHEKRLVDADPNPDVALRSLRFSPDSSQIVFVKSMLGFRGELWLVNADNGKQRPLVADRAAENPMDAGWILEGREVVYLTNRSGAYALWRIDLAENSILPLTVTLDAAPLDTLGISTWKDRVLVPRHFVDSDIVLSDGTKIAATSDLEMEPAVSSDAKLLAYTVQKDTRFEIWTSGVHGENPVFRALGREPRFSPSGFQMVYTNTDPSGNEDVWKVDLRNSAAESVTDAQEIDLQPDWSPDGRSIVFASARGGPVSVWTIPADGGKRLRLNDRGAYPRFTSNGRSLLFWNQDAFWTMDIDGSHTQRVRDGISKPAPAVWTARGPKYWADADVNHGQQIWPSFDVLPDGRFVISPIQVQETSLWAVDLTYEKKR